MKEKIGIIGCGNMGGAIIHGLMSRRLLPPESLMLSDPDAQKTKKIAGGYRVRVAKTNRELVNHCKVIILAVKPQQLPDALKEISRPVTHKLFISIAAGVRLSFLRRYLGKNVSLIRVMPNTPALVGEGMTALCRGRGVSETEWRLANRIFSCLGKVVHVEEKKMGIVTALSGSGPAYFFYLIEGLVDAGREAFLTEKEALTLTAQTALGSAKLLISSGVTPDELRRRVTSKGGTTEAAVKIFEKRGLKKILKEGVKAALCRSHEIERSRS